MSRPGTIDRVRSDYMPELFEPGQAVEMAARIVKAIKRSRIAFDAIAVRGASGMLIVPHVALLLKKPIIMVRKDETTHSASKVEGFARMSMTTSNHPAFRYIILDDFIDSGATVARIREALTEHRPGGRLVAVATWKTGQQIIALRPNPKNDRSGLDKVLPDRLTGKAYEKRSGDIPVVQARSDA